jgi:hypothetical protein
MRLPKGPKSLDPVDVGLFCDIVLAFYWFGFFKGTLLIVLSIFPGALWEVIWVHHDWNRAQERREKEKRDGS